MADNKRKKRADKSRVALRQDWEREYMIRELDSANGYLCEALRLVRCQAARLRAGFPAGKRSKGAKR